VESVKLEDGRPWTSAMSLARFAYSAYDSMNSFPASSFRLDSGKGTINRHRITVKTCRRVVSAVQSRFRVLTQISPAVEMFGWKIRVRKKPFGGVAGKSPDITSLRL
jgi:hypothetical protein